MTEPTTTDATNFHTPRTYENTVLIVDDNDNNRFYLHFLMTKHKLVSVEASGGLQALELWKTGTFSFIFLDLEMPDINGLQVATQIRASDPGVAIIMCSANDDGPSITEAARCDCDMYIVKPLMINVLLELIPNMKREELRSLPTMTVIYNTGGRRQEVRRSRKATAPLPPLPVDSLEQIAPSLNTSSLPSALPSSIESIEQIAPKPMHDSDVSGYVG